MTSDLSDLAAFVAVFRAAGFRGAATATGTSASGLSEQVKRLEGRLGVRLLNRTTRSVTPTEAGARLYENLLPAFDAVDAALDVVNDFRESPRGTLRLNVPGAAARLILPAIIPPFLQLYPDIVLDIVVDEAFVDVFAAGSDAGIRYDERLDKDMIAVPIGPRRQRFAAAAAPSYLAERGVPEHPRDLLAHSCIRGQFSSGAMAAWEFEKDGESVRISPAGPLVVRIGAGTDLLVQAAIGGVGIVSLFEDWLAPEFARGTLVPVLEPWWLSFAGPFLYYPGGRRLPAPLRAFVDFVKRDQRGTATHA